MDNAWRQAIVALERIARDHSSGSAEIAARAARLFKIYLRRSRTLSRPALVRRLEEIARGLIAAQPSMAPILNLANTVLLALERQDGDSATVLSRELTHFERALNVGPQKIARRFARVVPPGASIVTYSYSSTVLRALLAAQHSRKRFRVFCSESRPMLEGRRLAGRLARAGVPVALVVDALLPSLVCEADLVVTGADALMSRGFVNKIGTRGLAKAAAEARVPFYVLADHTKFLPARLERWYRSRKEPPSEVWRGRPRGVGVLNRYFELIPWAQWRGVRILTGQGVLSPHKLGRAVARMPVARRLC